MGNGAVSQDGSYKESYAMDVPVDASIVTKPVKPKSPRGDDSKSTDGSKVVPQDDQQSSNTPDGEAQAKSRTESKLARRTTMHAASAEDSESDSEDLEPVDVLLQFIPYYGQGDPANDSIVRSTLSGLSIEDIDSKDEYGNTLLLLACQYRCEDLVRIMLNKGADPNAVNNSGACCLHFACYRESSSYAVAKTLLKNGANPDVAETTFGCTPLHYCAGTGDIDFCKLLLSYGAQITAKDFYNYTCVDYASEAGMNDVANFLQTKLDQAAKLQARSSFSLNNGATASMGSSKNNGIDDQDISNWESHVDPDTGGKYYIHMRTGECLWEAELKARIQQQYQQQPSSSSKSPGRPSEKSPARPGSSSGSKINEAKLISEATQARLVIFFTQHDPARLGDIEALAEQYKGREHELLSELCRKYNVQMDGELKAFQQKLNELRPMKQASEPVSDPSMIDPLLLQDLAHEERKKFDAKLEEELALMKKKYDAMMDEEKANFRSAMSEKEGTIAKLQGEIDALARSKGSTEVSKQLPIHAGSKGQEARANKVCLASSIYPPPPQLICKIT